MSKLKIFIYAIAAIAFFSIPVMGQKLPGKQELSLAAPDNVKVDGKATEWDSKYQAYNKATEFFYTISNNDKELYLTVYCNLPSVIRRIMNGGLSLTINKSGKKSDPTPVVITYPIFDAGNRFSPVFWEVAKNGPIRFPAPVVVSFSSVSGAASNEKPLTDPVSDSLMTENNRKIAAKAKSIGIIGIAGLDSLISVYNTDGVRAVGQFDNKMGYVFEMSVSLKNLALIASDAANVMYQLKINEVAQRGITFTRNPSGDGGSVTASAGATMGQPATDFWGEYTLKK